jgi:hypothetical protein
MGRNAATLRLSISQSRPIFFALSRPLVMSARTRLDVTLRRSAVCAVVSSVAFLPLPPYRIPYPV